MTTAIHKPTKKYIRFIGFLSLYFFVVNANAQSFSLGGAIVYGDDVEQLGLHLRGYYNLKNNKVCFGPEYSNFFKAKEFIGGDQITKKLDELNFNVHYVFEINEALGFYPLTGLNYSTEKEEVETANGMHSFSKYAMGVNLGFGFHKLKGRTVFFAEYDHLFSDLSQNSILIGFFYNLSKMKEHEE